MHAEFDALEGVAQPAPDQVDGDMGNVDADPPPVEFFGGMDGGAAAAKRVEHQVAGVGGGGNDALQQGDGFLGGVAEAFLGRLIDAVDVNPDIAHRDHSVVWIEGFLIPSTWKSVVRWKVDQVSFSPCIQLCV